jgi:hypothetical protein
MKGCVFAKNWVMAGRFDKKIAEAINRRAKEGQ